MDISIREALLKEQKNEITAHHIYRKLAAAKIKQPENSDLLSTISKDELAHYHKLKEQTGVEVKENTLKIYFYYFISIILGITFGVKLLEKNEKDSLNAYSALAESMPMLWEIMKDEEEHERSLIEMINEERLQYTGSIVLGLNDALVELTGALAGYTFAFQNTKLIALTGLITGISASFSMASAEYLSSKQDKKTREALKAASYTGASYVFTVILLILPFLFIPNPYISLITTLLIALLVIFVFNYYVAIAKDLNFKKRFLEMAVISMGVAAVSFLVGMLVKALFGIDI